jgi:hypothetical protein
MRRFHKKPRTDWLGPAIAALPDTLSEAELVSFILTLVHAYEPDRMKGLHFVLSMSVTYCQSQGVPVQALGVILSNAAKTITEITALQAAQEAARAGAKH